MGYWALALVLSVRVASRREVVGVASRREVLGMVIFLVSLVSLVPLSSLSPLSLSDRSKILEDLWLIYSEASYAKLLPSLPPSRVAQIPVLSIDEIKC